MGSCSVKGWFGGGGGGMVLFDVLFSIVEWYRLLRSACYVDVSVIWWK